MTTQDIGAGEQDGCRFSLPDRLFRLFYCVCR